jgi:hypothetical protein
MGCHLGSGQADGVPAHEPAHGGVLRRVPVWFRPHSRVRVMFTTIDSNLHLGTTHDTFMYHRVEGIVGLVS